MGRDLSGSEHLRRFGYKTGRRGYKGKRRLLREMREHYEPYTCALCDITLDIRGVTIDHIRPVSKGGSERDPRNMRVTCKRCNYIHGDQWDGKEGYADEVPSLLETAVNKG